MRTLCAVIALFAVLSCGAQKVEPTNPQTQFSSWDEATRYVQDHYNADVMRPDSTAIAKAESYHASGRGYMILYFTSKPSKGYIYRGVPESVWREFKDAPSKGQFYQAQIKGRYYFQLSR